MQRGFIQIPILIAIIAGVLVLCGGTYFGIQKYQGYQAEKLEQKNQDEEQRLKLQELLDSQSTELEKQKSAIEALKNKKPEIITQTIVQETPAQKTENDLPSIINQWRPRVAYIECTYKYSNGQIYQISGGSGILEKASSPYTNHSTRLILTNKHVLKDLDIYTPDNCQVRFPGRAEIYSFKIEDIGYSNKPNIDFGGLWFLSPDQYILNLSETSIKKCSANIGDKILILGYPSYSNNSDITVTEGIISGYESPYYTTSAKLEHGNSGGIALSVKDNCYIGIPSGAVVGEIESLGRILDYRFWY